MAKDAYWFKHDSNASRDLKLMQIKAIYGLEGLGIYWSIIEVLREQNNHSWSEDSLHILAKIIDCDDKKFSNFVADAKRIGLLNSSDKMLCSNRLCRDMEIYESKRSNGSAGGLAKSKQNRSESLAKPKRIAGEQGTRRGEERREDIMYVGFLQSLNSAVGKSYRGSDKVKRSFEARLTDGYELSDFELAIKNAVSEQHHVESKFKWLTPEFFTRADKLDKFINSAKVMPQKEQIEVTGKQMFPDAY